MQHPHLVLAEVDAELVDSVLAEVAGEHVARARAVTEGVRHGDAFVELSSPKRGKERDRAGGAENRVREVQSNQAP